MNGIADGFFKGFGLMDQHYARKDSQEFRDRQYADQQSQLSINNARQETMDGMAQSRHAVDMANNGLTLALNGKKISNYDEDRTNQQEVQNLQKDASRAQIATSKASATSLNLNNRSEQNNQAQERLNFYLESGNPSAAFEDPLIRNTNFALLDDPTARKAAINIKASLDSGDFMQDPDMIPNMNILFKPQLNRHVNTMKSRDGTPIKDIKIIGIEQADEEMAKIKVRVKTEKGSYDSYLSEMRSSDPNDPLRKMNIETLIGTGDALGNVAMMLEQNDYNKGVESRRQGVEQRMPQMSGNGVPAKIQEYEYIRSMIGDDGLRNFITQSKGLSQSLMWQSAVKQATSAIKNDYYPTPEERVKAVEFIASRLMEMSMQYSQSQGIPYQGLQGGQPQSGMSSDAEAALNRIGQGLQQLQNQ